MAYIEKEKINNYIRANFSIDKTQNADICFAFIDFMNWLDDAPTADVVEVTRCSNCKYIKTFTCPITGTKTLFCDYGEKPVQVAAEHYCGYGERKDM